MIKSKKDFYRIHAYRENLSGLLSVDVYFIFSGYLCRSVDFLLIDPELEYSVFNSKYLRKFWGPTNYPTEYFDVPMQFMCRGYEFFAEFRCNPPEGTPYNLSYAVGVLGKDFLQKYQWKPYKKISRIKVFNPSFKDVDYYYFICTGCCYPKIIRKEEYPIYESRNKSLILKKYERLLKIQALFDEKDWELSLFEKDICKPLEEAQGKVLVCPDCGIIMEQMEW